MNYKVPWTSDFFVNELEDAEKGVVTRKSRPLATDFFLWRFYKRFRLAEKIRDLHHLREKIDTSVAPITT
jgi:hypothetical protein